MNAATIQSAILETQAIGDEILETIKGVDPELALPAATAEIVLNLVVKYVGTALAAYQEAAQQPINAETVQALLPDQTPLPAADSK